MNLSKLRQERNKNITTPWFPLPKGSPWDSIRRGNDLRKVILTTIVFLAMLPLQLRAQEGTWSLGGSVGYGVLSLGDVDAKNSRDVAGYNDQGLPIDEMPSLKAAPIYTGKITYRYTREFGFSLSVAYAKKEVSSVYNGPDDYLMLKRGVSSTDVTVGMLYYPAAQPYFLEWYGAIDFGILLARANAETFGTHTYKINGQPYPTPTVDTKGSYKKSKLDVAARFGAEISVLRSGIVRLEGGYRFAVLGKLNGDVLRLTGNTNEDTSIDFDYSAFFATVGVGIEF